MSLRDYADFVYGAGMLDEDDPVSFWKAEGAKQQTLIRWLKGHDQAVIKGSNVDITLSIKERPFIECSGRENFPDGEIFTRSGGGLGERVDPFQISSHLQRAGDQRY
jgi:aminopeptidase